MTWDSVTCLPGAQTKAQFPNPLERTVLSVRFEVACKKRVDCVLFGRSLWLKVD